jgi:hypothetical protein
MSRFSVETSALEEWLRICKKVNNEDHARGETKNLVIR